MKERDAIVRFVKGMKLNPRQARNGYLALMLAAGAIERGLHLKETGDE